METYQQEKWETEKLLDQHSWLSMYIYFFFISLKFKKKRKTKLKFNFVEVEAKNIKCTFIISTNGKHIKFKRAFKGHPLNP